MKRDDLIIVRGGGDLATGRFIGSGRQGSCAGAEIEKSGGDPATGSSV